MSDFTDWRNCIRTVNQVLSRSFSTRQSSSLRRRLFQRHLKRSRRRVIRYSLLAANVGLLAGVVLFVSQSPSNSASSQNSVLGPKSIAAANPLDQLSAADIAVHASRMTALPEAVAITNQADSESSQLSITPADNVLVSKPQLVNTSIKSAKDIQAYVTQPGDTVQGLASKFGITSDSIRWSNSLTSNTLNAGRQLVIPPVNGVVYVVKPGDTAENLAQRYAANKDVIIADNDAEVSGIRVGQRILIRDGILPVTRATVVAPSTTGFSFGTTAIYGYNGYDRGYCTWYVANKRISIGRALPANLGDAWTWDDRARAAGLTVNNQAAYGAAVVTATSRRPGHVAFVEQVNDDGSIWVSEMNSRGQVSMTDTRPAGGWGKVDFKLISADVARTFNYIH